MSLPNLTPRSDIESLQAVEIPSWMGLDTRYSYNNYTPPTSLHVLPDSVLSRYPYCCVGKLFWFRPPSGPQDVRPDLIYYCTAFYVGNNKILTVAHAFDLGGKRADLRYPQYPEREAIFVPAMRTKDDYLGEKFGSYLISNVEPKDCNFEIFNINDIPYNICSADVHSRMKQGRAVNIEEELRSYIALQSHDPRTTCGVSVIGYGFYSQNEDQRMCIMRNRRTNSMPSGCIRHDEGTPLGMSGGPWMLSVIPYLLESYHFHLGGLLESNLQP